MRPVLAIFKATCATRFCDETCYDAQGVTCACICKGKNHGLGYARAVANSAELILHEAALRILFPNIKASDALACNADVHDAIQKLWPQPDHVDP